MGRKTITSGINLEASTIRIPVSQQDIWSALKTVGECGTFSARDIAEFVNHQAGRHEIAQRTVNDYLRRLAAANYLSATPEPSRGGGTRNIYSLTERDRGFFAPSVAKDGTELPQHTPGTLRMWRVMRALKGFDCVELAQTAEVHTGSAKDYIKRLTSAGILKRIGHRQPGMRGQYVRYMLPDDKYTGPLAPQILKISAVYDPNTGAIISYDGEFLYQPERMAS